MLEWSKGFPCGLPFCVTILFPSLIYSATENEQLMIPATYCIILGHSVFTTKTRRANSLLVFSYPICQYCATYPMTVPQFNLNFYPVNIKVYKHFLIYLFLPEHPCVINGGYLWHSACRENNHRPATFIITWIKIKEVLRCFKV